MSEQPDNLIQDLKRLGISGDGAKVYIHLFQHGPQSALQISRRLKMARTKVYRILEKLEPKGLIQEKMDSPGRKFQAAASNQLELLLLDRQNELKKLEETFPSILRQLDLLDQDRSSESKVIHYKGEEGLRQITWNSLKAKKELCIFEIAEGMHQFTGENFAEKAREEFYLRNIVTKQLTNFKEIKPFTEVENFVKNCMNVRYIDPKELKVVFEVLIYNDVVAIYTYKGESFGVEIYNKFLARMQRQFFDFFWKRAEKMKVGKGGSAKLIAKKK